MARGFFGSGAPTLLRFLLSSAVNIIKIIKYICILPQMEILGLPAGLMTGLPLALSQRNKALGQWKDVKDGFQLDTLPQYTTSSMYIYILKLYIICHLRNHYCLIYIYIYYVTYVYYQQKPPFKLAHGSCTGAPNRCGRGLLGLGRCRRLLHRWPWL